MADLIIVAAGLAGLLLVILAYTRGWGKGGARGFGALTAFHDLQPKDRQHATEVVIEQKAGKRRFDQSDDGSLEPGDLRRIGDGTGNQDQPGR